MCWDTRQPLSDDYGRLGRFGGTHGVVGGGSDARERHGPAGLDLGQGRHHVRAHVGRDDHQMTEALRPGRVLGRARVVARVRPLHRPQTQEVHRRLVPTAGSRVGRHHRRGRLRRPSVRPQSAPLREHVPKRRDPFFTVSPAPLSPR